MPYVEIHAAPASASRKRTAARAVTAAVVEHLGVLPGTVTIYFVIAHDDDYAHAGVLGDEAAGRRVFAKLHAYPRPLAQRRALAGALAPVLAECFGTPPADVALYFLDRAVDEVAHGGRLVCDEPPAIAVTP